MHTGIYVYGNNSLKSIFGMVMNDMLECKHSGSTPWHSVSINNESHYLSSFDLTVGLIVFMFIRSSSQVTD